MEVCTVAGLSFLVFALPVRLPTLRRLATPEAFKVGNGGWGCVTISLIWVFDSFYFPRKGCQPCEGWQPRKSLKAGAGGMEI